ncbi:5-methyltetrahydropteroyltriglutamate/homocysteine S-methyltransferase [Enterobacter cancerogenus]|uniref:5-methyltetrahydropteroyltriglutamate/homocysteine S-methyltransferase n=1 Tax=Enterobacter cancerogenus TaxID=69218 RepID=A0A484XJQ9_9ENTR|nr:5-methyltetrahydropteroyltriglutamate/homocysteine S-methyltransferase [Enterobacter cancerogenus]
MQRQHAPYRADVVGSFLRPDAIKQARVQFAG